MNYSKLDRMAWACIDVIIIMLTLIFFLLCCVALVVLGQALYQLVFH
jgi:hypothetical protein